MKARDALEVVREHYPDVWITPTQLDNWNRALALLTALVEEHEARVAWRHGLGSIPEANAVEDTFIRTRQLEDDTGWQGQLRQDR